MSKTSNVYQKLAEARSELGKVSLKKSGFNGFAKYQYYQLDDFLPQINVINQTLGLCSWVDFGNDDYIKLHIVDADNPESEIIFSSRNVGAGIKGAIAIQNMGGEQTYQRRYLYLQAYEITESDAIEAVDPKEKIDVKRKPAKYKLTKEEFKSLEIHLQTLTTVNQINNSYTAIEERAKGGEIDKPIQELYQFYTEELKNATQKE